MKIGAFATHNNLTIDTIRHYMSLDLIVPEKVGSQYDFDDRCQTDLNEIIHFKSLGFSLHEIQNLLILRRIGRLTGYEKSLYYQSFFEHKLNEITATITQLDQMSIKLKNAVKELDNAALKPDIQTTFGISFPFLQQIACHKCKSSMILSQGAVVNQKIVSGRLTCACGVAYTIEEGILIVDPLDLISTKALDGLENNYMEDYITHTDYNYLSKLYKSFEWAYKNINLSGYAHKNLLDLGVGHGFFLRYFYESIGDSNRYIAVDHDIGRLKWLQRRLAVTPASFDLVLIACDFMKIPLQDQSVDVVLDISGSSNYAFDKPDFLLSRLTKLYRPQCDLIASFLLFKNFSSHSKIEAHLRENFMLKPVKASLKALGFKQILDYESETVNKGGKFEDFFVEGENIFSYIYYGKRWG